MISCYSFSRNENIAENWFLIKSINLKVIRVNLSNLLTKGRSVYLISTFQHEFLAKCACNLFKKILKRKQKAGSGLFKLQ